jgi:hypothetical protein
MRHGSDDPMCEPQQRVGVRLHRSGNIDQHDNPAHSHAWPSAAQWNQLARSA